MNPVPRLAIAAVLGLAGAAAVTIASLMVLRFLYRDCSGYYECLGIFFFVPIGAIGSLVAAGWAGHRAAAGWMGYLVAMVSATAGFLVTLLALRTALGGG